MKSRSILSLGGAIALLLFAISSQTLSADGVHGKFTYTEDETGVTISDYPEDEKGAVNIPAEINSKPVTTIGVEAFRNCRKITKVTLPASIKRINDRAFYYCSVSSVNFPEGLASIGQFAFFKCGNLLEISLPESLTDIGPWAFRQCAKLETAELPDSMEVIPIGMFAVSGIREIQFPPALTRIGGSAFRDCNKLEELAVPPTVTQIGSEAFRKCLGLKKVTFSEGLKTIDQGAFSGCEKLARVVFPASLEAIGKFAFRHRKDGLVNVTFLGDAPSLGTWAFKVRHAEYPEGFLIRYKEGAEGFTSPEWHGYPAIAIHDGADIGVEQPVGTTLEDGKAKKSFGSALFGKKGGVKTFTVKNTGAETLTGLAITVDGANAGSFKIEQPNKTTVPPGEARIFKVTFKPAGLGEQKASVHVITDQTTENTFDIKVAGFGVGVR